MGEGLGSPESSIGRADRSGRSKHGAVTVKHDEGSALIGEPAERRKRYESISPDYY
jgi:hypothetical protein